MSVGVGSWLVFGWLWLDLLGDGKASSAAIAASALHVLGIAVLVLLVILVWVAHNVSIHRRKGARGGRPVVLPRTDVDRLGRPVTWDLTGMHVGARVSGHLTVSVENGTKTYRNAAAMGTPCVL